MIKRTVVLLYYKMCGFLTTMSVPALIGVRALSGEGGGAGLGFKEKIKYSTPKR